jgi:hypothetical protein
LFIYHTYNVFLFKYYTRQEVEAPVDGRWPDKRREARWQPAEQEAQEEHDEMQQHDKRRRCTGGREALA